MMTIQIIGNLGSNAAVRNINGRDYVSFDVAHTEGSGDRRRTFWVSCLWRYGGGTVVQYLTKGTRVYVSGSYSDSLFTRKDGSTGISRSVMADNVVICGGTQQPEVAASAASPAQHSSQPQPQSQTAAASLDDDLPF